MEAPPPTEQLELDEIPAPPSPYEGTVLTAKDHLPLSAFWFATNVLWGAMLLILLPSIMKTVAPPFQAQGLGVFTAIGAIPAILVPLIVGPLSDRCRSLWGRRRPYIAVGLAINVFGLAVMAFVAYAVLQYHGAVQGTSTSSLLEVLPKLFQSPYYWSLLVGYFLVQLGNNIGSAAFMGVIPDLVPKDQRGVASGYMAVMSQVGTLLGAIVTGMALGFLSDSLKVVVVAAILILATCWTLFGIKESPLSVKPAPVQWARYLRSLRIDGKAHPDFMWVWRTRFLVMLGFYAVVPFVNYYFRDVIGSKNADSDAVKFLAVVLVTSSLSGFYGGKLSDRVGRKKLVEWSSLGMAAGVILFITARTLGQIIVLGAIFGIAYGAYVSVDWALGTDVLPNPRHAAKDMAVWHIAMTLPQSIAPPLAGFLIGAFAIPSADVTAHYKPLGYAVVFVLCAISFVMGGILLKNVKGVR